MLFTYKGVSVEVPEGRLEVCRLKGKFDDYATGMRDEVMKSFDEKFKDMRAFLSDGDEWAHGFIDRGADMVIRELGVLGCYDMDRESWIEKYIDYSAWDASTKPYRAMVAELDGEEAAREAQRAARTEAWGNTYSEHKVTMHSDGEGNAEMRDRLDGGNIVANLGLSAASGLFNMIGRGMSKSKIERQLKEAFESSEFRMGVESGILDSVANAYVAFIDYCMKSGIKTDYIPFTQDELDKSNRLLNNIERGLIPTEKLDAMIANALVADSHNERIYQMLLIKGEDKDGALTKIADFFHFHKLDKLKKTAFLKECGDPTITMDKELARELKEYGEVVISSETEFVAYKEKYVTVARNVQLPDAELSKLIAKLEHEYANAVKEEEERRRKEEEDIRQETAAEKKGCCCFAGIFCVAFGAYGKFLTVIPWVGPKLLHWFQSFIALKVEQSYCLETGGITTKEGDVWNALKHALEICGFAFCKTDERRNTGLTWGDTNENNVGFTGTIDVLPQDSGKYAIALKGDVAVSQRVQFMLLGMLFVPVWGWLGFIAFWLGDREIPQEKFKKAIEKVQKELQ